MGLVPGNRVLLRAPNNPMLAACWFAVMKAGAIAVATMPLLRAKELTQIIAKAQVTHALCDLRLADELRDAMRDAAGARPDALLQRRDRRSGLEAAMARHAPTFDNVATAADDTCMLAFTSGTTGQPKATMHFHRDVMAACACLPRHVLRPRPDDVFIGSPPLAFTFGLGGLLLFPMSVGASTVLLERPRRRRCWTAIPAFGATTLVTAPTSYRAMAEPARALRLARAAGRHAAPVRLGGRSAAGIDARAVEGRHRHRADRRHRRDRDAAHLHLGRRGARPPRRHRHGRARLPRLRRRRRGRPVPVGTVGTPRGEGPDRLPLSRR